MVIGSSGASGVLSVAVTVVSVGPYPFSTHRPAQRTVSSGGTDSPPTTTVRSRGRVSGSSEPATTGVTFRCVTSSLRRTLASSSPAYAAGGTTATVAPTASATSSSSIEMSKLGDTACAITASEPTPKAAPEPVTRFARPRWVTPTPLGRPVEPEV
ncbi:hypothetical protein Ntsu_23950 [Nocardia sp. IFM 10818]